MWFFPTQNPRIQESSQKDSAIFLTQNPRIQAKKTVKFSYTQIPRIQGLWDPRIQESSQKRKCFYSKSKNPGIQPKRQRIFFDSESKNPAKKDSAISLYSESKNPRLVGIQESRNQATKTAQFLLVRIWEYRDSFKTDKVNSWLWFPRIQGSS